MSETNILHSFDSDEFFAWVRDFEYFTVWGEIYDDEEYEEYGDEAVDWCTEAACRTPEVAELIGNNYKDAYTPVKVCRPGEIDVDDFPNDDPEVMIAVFDMRETPDPDFPGSDKVILCPADECGQPIAITRSTEDAETVAKFIEDNGLVAVFESPIVSTPQDHDDRNEASGPGVYHDFDSNRFYAWVRGFEHFTVWGETYDDDEVITWNTEAACRTREVAELIGENYEDGYTPVKICGPTEVDVDSFPDEDPRVMIAVFDTVEAPDPEFPESGDTVLYPADDNNRPLAITRSILDAETVVKFIEDNGLLAVLECPKD